MRAKNVINELSKYENPTDAEFLARFFKTGKGEYGQGDIFIGVRLPVLRKIARQFGTLSFSELEKLLESPIHEHRLTALIIMTYQMKRANTTKSKQIYQLYLKRTDRINNWDLVDVSCRDIVGRYLIDKNRDNLYKLAGSANMWERRIAMVSTWWFIREGQLDDTFLLANKLLQDSQDLIQKAVGWMLREAGKKNQQALVEFLEEHANNMPRTALRYSIERLDKADKDRFMSAKYSNKIGILPSLR